MTERHHQCAELLFLIYKDFDVAALPQSVRVRVWEVFANRVRAAARQSTNLRMFVEKLSGMLDIHALSHPEILNLLHDDEECLQLLRDETKLLVLMVRQKVADEKEAKKNAKR